VNRRGRVVALDDEPLSAVVELDDMPSCGRCATGRGCGIVLLPSSDSAVRIACGNAVGAQPGQSVTVEAPDPPRGWLWLVLGAYGLPTLGLLLGACIGLALMSWSTLALTTSIPDVYASTGALLGLLGGLFAWSRVSQAVATSVGSGLCLRDARIVCIHQAPS